MAKKPPTEKRPEQVGPRRTSWPHHMPAPIFEMILDELEGKFQNGDKRALLDAVSHCLDHGVSAPQWVADGFSWALWRWSRMLCKTLDAAFGVEWKKGKSFVAARREQRLGLRLAHDVSLLAREGAAIDGDLFAAVGALRGAGKTYVANCHKKYGKVWGDPRRKRRRKEELPPELAALLLQVNKIGGRPDRVRKILQKAVLPSRLK